MSVYEIEHENDDNEMNDSSDSNDHYGTDTDSSSDDNNHYGTGTDSSSDDNNHYGSDIDNSSENNDHYGTDTDSSSDDNNHYGSDIDNSSENTEYIYGSAEIDDAYYQGIYAEYTLQRNSDSIQLVDETSGRNGTDILESVERIHFDDVSLALDVDAGQNAGIAYRMYRAALDRAPDTVGLSGWIEALDNGNSLESVASGFINSSEFQNKYGADSSSEEFVTLLYNNVLHRDPDAQGMSGWIQALETGSSREQVLIGFSESTENINQTASLIATGIQYQEWIG